MVIRIFFAESAAQCESCIAMKRNIAREKRFFIRWVEQNLGFEFGQLGSLEKFTGLMYRPTDAAGLGVARAFFGRIFHKRKIYILRIFSQKSLYNLGLSLEQAKIFWDILPLAKACPLL